MKKKLIGLLLVMAMVTSIFATVAFANSRQVDLLLEEDAREAGITVEELLAIEAEVDAIYGENFSANQREAFHQIGLIDASFSRARDGSVMYPDFFGGVALNYYDASLLIFIVESELEQAYSDNVIGRLLEDGVTYVLVEYSRTELIEGHSTVRDIIDSRRDCVYARNVTITSTDPIMNRVVVSIEVYNYDMISGFRRYVYDSPMLAFEQSSFRFDMSDGQGGYNFRCDSANSTFDYTDYCRDCLEHYQTEISPTSVTWGNPGNRVRRMVFLFGRANYATIGFRVRCFTTNTTGFLTTASVFNNWDDLRFMPNGNTGGMIGTVVMSRFLPNQGINAAYVQTLNIFEVTNTFPNGRAITQQTTAPQVNTRVYAFGSETNGMVHGTIIRTDASFTCECCRSNAFRNMSYVARYTATSQSGDSGGPVITAQGHAVGLISGGYNTAFMVTPLYRIMNDFRQAGRTIHRY